MPAIHGRRSRRRGATYGWKCARRRRAWEFRQVRESGPCEARGRTTGDVRLSRLHALLPDSGTGGLGRKPVAKRMRRTLQAIKAESETHAREPEGRGGGSGGCSRVAWLLRGADEQSLAVRLVPEAAVAGVPTGVAAWRERLNALAAATTSGTALWGPRPRLPWARASAPSSRRPSRSRRAWRSLRSINSAACPIGGEPLLRTWSRAVPAGGMSRAFIEGQNPTSSP